MTDALTLATAIINATTDALATALQDATIAEPSPTAAAAAAAADAASAAMDPKRRYCHGTMSLRGTFPPNYWLVPTGKTMAADTRCAHCQDVLGFRDGTHVPANTCASFNCDSASDPALTRVSYKGFNVGLSLLGHTDVPLYLDPENRHKTADGVGIFVVPTQTEFQIVIDRAITGLGFGQVAFDTFTIEEATVGDEKIVINGGSKVLYDSGRAVIRGFATGSDRSFLFVAPSEWEKANAPEARVAATLSESNIFTLKLQPHARKAKETPRRVFDFGFGSSKPVDYFDGIGRLSHLSFGSPPPTYGHPARAGDLGDGWGGSRGAAPLTLGGFGSFGAPAAPAGAVTGFGGGATSAFSEFFGGAAPATASTSFGAPGASTGFGGAAPPTTGNGFGSFGAAPAAAATSTGGVGSFGAAPPAPGASTTSTFGVAIPLTQQQQPKPGAPAVGGATVSGGTHIDHVKTQTTTDTYTPVGEPIIIKIQLICRQSDADRKRDNLRARLQQDGLDYWTNEAKKHLETKVFLEKELADVQVRLAKRIAAAKADWEGAVTAVSAVVGRNAPLLAQLSVHDVTGVQLNPRPTAQVATDKAAGDEARKSAMLLDV